MGGSGDGWFDDGPGTGERGVAGAGGAAAAHGRRSRSSYRCTTRSGRCRGACRCCTPTSARTCPSTGRSRSSTTPVPTPPAPWPTTSPSGTQASACSAWTAKGRGLTLRAAWSRSRADVVAYLDVDLSTGLDALLPLLAPLLNGHSDLAIGSLVRECRRRATNPVRTAAEGCRSPLAGLRHRAVTVRCGRRVGGRPSCRRGRSAGSGERRCPSESTIRRLIGGVDADRFAVIGTFVQHLSATVVPTTRRLRVLAVDAGAEHPGYEV